LGALEFLQVALLVFPKGIQFKLEEVRDLARSMLVEKDPLVHNLAASVYALVFRNVPRALLSEFQTFLQNEIDALHTQGSAMSSDPLLAKLDPLEMSRVKCLNTYALGLTEQTSTAYVQCQNFVKYLSDSDPHLRVSALMAILAMMPYLDSSQSNVMIWIILPLYADPSIKVRLAFVQFLRNIPSHLESLTHSLTSSSEDTQQLPQVKVEDILLDSETVVVDKQYLDDILFELNELFMTPPLTELPLEDDGFHLPTVSEKLAKRFKILAQAMTGPVPDNLLNETIFYLQAMQASPVNQANAFLVLSQFCCIHETTFQDVIEVFLTVQSQDITPDNSLILQACMLGLRNVSQNSNSAFKQIIQKLTNASSMNEGDILALLYLIDMVKENMSQKAKDFLPKFTSIVSSSRHTHRKRLYATYLCSKFLFSISFLL
jgi:hypothetical protein